MSATQEQLDSICRLLCSGEKANINLAEMLIMGLHVNLDELLKTWGFYRLGFDSFEKFSLGARVEHTVMQREFGTYESPTNVLAPLKELKTLIRLCCEFQDEKFVFGLPALENLRIFTCDITQIKSLEWLSKFPNLERIGLYGNHIADIKEVTVLKKLKHIDLRFNRVHDITPLAKLENLESVQLNGNRLSKSQDKNSSYMDNYKIDISPLYELPNLKGLSLSSVYSNLEMELHEKYLPNCQINYF